MSRAPYTPPRCLPLPPHRGLVGYGPQYGTGGYVVTLSLDRNAALATLSQMKQDR